MFFKVVKIGPELWKQRFSDEAHRISFSEARNYDERIDYALLGINEKDEPCGYMTCRELDSRSVYWQFGGMFPPVLDTIYSFRLLQNFLRWHRENYDRVSFLVENTNSVFLKMAMKLGFKITGVRNFKGSILLEHSMEFKDAN